MKFRSMKVHWRHWTKLISIQINLFHPIDLNLDNSNSEPNILYQNIIWFYRVWQWWCVWIYQLKKRNTQKLENTFGICRMELNLCLGWFLVQFNRMWAKHIRNGKKNQIIWFGPDSPPDKKTYIHQSQLNWKIFDWTK